MSKGKIAITGANGFIGSALVDHFSAKGWGVTAMVHRMPEKQKEGVLYVAYDLGKDPETGIFSGLDILIHCAFQLDAGGQEERNINGTRKLLEKCRNSEVKKIIFISSMSAREDAVSAYGKQKFMLQKDFNRGNELVIRPGLVIGNGGIFRKMFDFIGTKKMIPLVGGGRQPVQTIGIRDLVKGIDLALEKNIQGVLTLAEAQPATMKEFYKAMAESRNVSPRFISVPYWLAGLGLGIFKLLGLPAPVGKGNLKGLKSLAVEDTSADLEKIGLQPQRYFESMRTQA